MYEDDFIACDECGLLFQPKFAGATTCYSCWSQTAAGQRWRERKDAERARQAGAAGKGQQGPKSGQQGAQQSGARVEYLNCPGFDLGMVRLLLQLCHPDKHGNSDQRQGCTVAEREVEGIEREMNMADVQTRVAERYWKDAKWQPYVYQRVLYLRYSWYFLLLAAEQGEI